MARILIVGGGCRGRRLAGEMIDAGHAVRITTRTLGRGAASESGGWEWSVADPGRLATLRSSLENVTLACWLLGTASGGRAAVRALHTTRLRAFIGQLVDSTARGLIYEAGGTAVPPALLAEGARIARELAARNAIPLAVLSADPRDQEAWLGDARAAVDALLGAA